MDTRLKRRPQAGESHGLNTYRTALKVVRLSSELVKTIDDEVSPYELTFNQFSILELLNRNPQGLFLMEIRDGLPHRVPDASRLAVRLEEKGLVSRVQPAEDARMLLVKLTSKGEKAVKLLLPLVDMVINNRFGNG